MASEAQEPDKGLPRALPRESPLDAVEVARYSRQMLVPQLGRGFQEALKSSHCLVVGAGGLGATILPFLVGMGVGRVTVCDDDVVELSNLHRQVLFTEAAASERQPKADAVRAFCAALNSNVEVTVLPTRFTPKAADGILESRRPDVVVDATDNLPSRYAVSDACVRHGLPLVLGASVGIEGQLAVYNYEGGPCLRCVHPYPKANAKAPTCADSGVLGAVPGLIGCLQAIEAVKVMVKLKQEAPGLKVRDQMLHYNAAFGSFFSFGLPKKRPDCPACGTGEIPVQIIVPDACSSGVCRPQDPAADLDPANRIEPAKFASEWRVLQSSNSVANVNGHKRLRPVDGSIFGFENRTEDREKAALLDVRSETQRGIISLEGSVGLPLKKLRKLFETSDQTSENRRADVVTQLRNKPESSPCFVLCRRGVDSVSATKLLLEHGITNVVNVDGGLTRYAQEVDPDLPMY